MPWPKSCSMTVMKASKATSHCPLPRLLPCGSRHVFHADTSWYSLTDPPPVVHVFDQSIPRSHAFVMLPSQVLHAQHNQQVTFALVLANCRTLLQSTVAPHCDRILNMNSSSIGAVSLCLICFCVSFFPFSPCLNPHLKPYSPLHPSSCTLPQLSPSYSLLQWLVPGLIRAWLRIG